MTDGSTREPARIAVIGTGYVGLTTAIGMASVGHKVQCVDVNSDRVRLINGGHIPFFEPGMAEALAANLAASRLSATGDLERAVAASSIVFVTVGTPDVDGRIDLSQVAAAARSIGAVLRARSDYKVIVVKSTVVPGTTAGIVRRELEQSSGLIAGEFGLCMNPEFLREGSAMNDFMQPDRIVIGQWDVRSGAALSQLYNGFDCPQILTTLANAEMTKYASNALLATLISYSNEIAAVCEATADADVETVMRGVHSDRRWMPFSGRERLRPPILSFVWAGCGFGGSCLPKDVNALRSYAREVGVSPLVLDAVAQVNHARPARLTTMIAAALGSVANVRVAVLGLAFKPGTDDLRAAPALALSADLLSQGAQVRVFDPIVRPTAAVESLDPRATFCESAAIALAGADIAVVVTPHDEIVALDWQKLALSMRRPIVIDARNALDVSRWPATVQLLRIGNGGGALPAGSVN